MRKSIFAGLFSMLAWATAVAVAGEPVGGPSLPGLPVPDDAPVVPRGVIAEEVSPAPLPLMPPPAPTPGIAPLGELPPDISPYAERWRYVEYNGRWWHYTTNGRWMYWSEGRWVELPSATLNRRTVAAARPNGHELPPTTYVRPRTGAVGYTQPRATIGVGVGVPVYGGYRPYYYPPAYYRPRPYISPAVGVY
ncbi:MAG: hypothetical protein JSS27_14735 [Planctomycetes bacterium]|nr:hypothetical protein [Planctomycetota bacterium]